MNYIKCPKCGQEDAAFDYAHVCGPLAVKKSFNKRLREFERESGLEIYGLGARRDRWEQTLTKFAQLIIEECAQQVDWILAEDGKTQGDVIKQHFGVEQ
jgi:hypothetical protein